MLRRISVFVVVAGLLSSASAYDWYEGSGGSGDAGDTIATAQVITGPAGLTRIYGISPANDVDIYKISIPNPASFVATTATLTASDTQLFLFDSSGHGVTFNDDIVSATQLQSRITGQFVPSPGTYYLAVTRYDTDPIDVESRALWQDEPFTSERAPDGPGAANAFTNWDTGHLGMVYVISLTACDPAVAGAEVPPPSDLYYESPDAGDTIATAQRTAGLGVLTRIVGKTLGGSDVDMYAIKIVNPAIFSVNTVLNGNGIGDNQLSLFDGTGHGIAFNDDTPSGTNFQAEFPAGNSAYATLAPGTYYLAVALVDSPAVSSMGNIWNAEPFNVVRPPDGPGSANPLTGWQYSTFSTSNYYVLDLTGCEYAVPPIYRLTPTQFLASPGTVMSGGLAELSLSDAAYLQVRPGPSLVAAPYNPVMQFSATAPGSTCTFLQVTVETRASVKYISQIVEARNFVTGTWVQIDTWGNLPNGPEPDRAVTINLPSPAPYVSSSGLVQVRVRVKPTRALLVYPWSVLVDEISWRFSP